MAEFLGEGGTRVSLEIGCGHGHWLTSLAENSPEERLIGVDLISRRIRLAEAKVAKRDLTNTLFLKAEATETLEAWPETVALKRIFLLHPDPWPKKRHAKNRMTGPAFLDRMAAAASPGCEFYFRTDDAPFFEWSRESLEAHPAWKSVELPWPHEAGSYFKDMLGVHGALTAVRV
ncbi:tRNA (guanine-N7-)-methyltransferase [Puniceicoccus vermicola]